jgi:dTDP-4-dehydrorhamnose 3,5-epimerase-like enzyme
MTVHWEPVTIHKDQRGWVFEPLNEDHFINQKNAHVVLTEPGAIRGNHYHQHGTEIIAICGPALVRFRDDNQIEDVQIPADEAYRFSFPPGIAHTIQNTGNKPNITIAFNSRAHACTQKETDKDILIQ